LVSMLKIYSMQKSMTILECKNRVGLSFLNSIIQLINSNNQNYISMKNNILKFALMGITLSALSFASCSKEDIIKTDPEIEDPDNRWITVSGALMQTEPGDGNGGTQI